MQVELGVKCLPLEIVH